MRRAGQGDIPAIRACLAAMIDSAMFPLSNLDRFGLDGEHDFAPRMWVAEREGRITDVLTLGRGGTILPALPGADWSRAVAALRGRSVNGCIGPTSQVRPLMSALGLADAPASLDRDEPHFALDLDRLRVPEGTGSLRPLQEADAGEMIRWRAAYCVEALGTPPGRALEAGRRDYAAYVEAGSHRVLMEGDQSLATTGFNATAQGVVQIGGVYTPPALRGRGHARRSVALHLAEAREAGAGRAILFAASEAAAAAYRAVGFERIGDWTLHILADRVTVHG